MSSSTAIDSQKFWKKTFWYILIKPVKLTIKILTLV